MQTLNPYGKPGFCIVPEIERPPLELLEELVRFPVAVIGDAMGARGIMHHGIKPLCREATVCGPAITVETRSADNLMVHTALKLARAGDVIVVDAHGDLSAGIWGGLTTAMAMRKGLAGLVIDGAVRDSAELTASGFPVFTRGVCARGGGKEGPGQVNMPISCAGVPIQPGDAIVGDADGVVVVPRALLKETLASARNKMEKEALRMAAIQGEDPEGIYPPWLIPTLRERGVLPKDVSL